MSSKLDLAVRGSLRKTNVEIRKRTGTIPICLCLFPVCFLISTFLSDGVIPFQNVPLTPAMN